MGFHAEASKSNPYWISKHRYYELKHFCLQYDEWSKLYFLAKSQTIHEEDDPTGLYATIMADCQYCMDLVKETARGTDSVLGSFIFEYVTTGKPYEILRTKHEIPCGRDLFYSYARKFFWLLSKEKGV